MAINTDSEAGLCFEKVEPEDAEASLPLQAKPTDTSSMRGGGIHSLQIIQERTSEDVAAKPFKNSRRNSKNNFQRVLFADCIFEGESPAMPLDDKVDELGQDCKTGKVRTITGQQRRLNVY